ncbi:hypothetical protein V3C99_016010, partial [Haemonchus contortus]
ILFPLPPALTEELQPEKLRVWDTNSRSIVDQLQMLAGHTLLQIRTCDLLLGDNATMQMLANERFDAGITEMLGACGFGLFDKIGIDHIITASSLGMVDTMGDLFDVPKFPSIVPSFLLPYNSRMNFVERTINFVVAMIADIVSAEIGRNYKKVWSRHGVSTDDEYYKSKTNYLLTNSDEFLEFGRPTSPKIVHVGGIALKETGPLSKDLQQIMEQTRVGVVYISFGSAVPTIKMPKYFRDAITEVAKTFKNYDFIWKVDEGDKIEGIPNLYTFTWVAQQALLAHPNLRCFVSHAGLNSVLELTRSGKPSILVPIFADQFRNARLVEAKNTTIVIAKEDFTQDAFAVALQRVLGDISYSKRAERLASLMVNKPFPVRDRLLSSVNFSIQHGRIYDYDFGKHLNALQYHSVDVIAFLIILLISTVFMWFYTCRYFFRKIFQAKIKAD